MSASIEAGPAAAGLYRRLRTLRPDEALPLSEAFVRERVAALGLDPRGVMSQVSFELDRESVNFGKLVLVGRPFPVPSTEPAFAQALPHASRPLVVAHETGHALHSSLGDGRNFTETTMLREHVGDRIGAAVTGYRFHRGPATHVRDFIRGEGNQWPNAAIPNNAADQVALAVGDAALGQAYVRVLERRPEASNSLAVLARELIVDLGDTHSGEAADVAAAAWSSIGVDDGFRAAGKLLPRPWE